MPGLMSPIVTEYVAVRAGGGMQLMTGRGLVKFMSKLPHLVSAGRGSVAARSTMAVETCCAPFADAPSGCAA